MDDDIKAFDERIAKKKAQLMQLKEKEVKIREEKKKVGLAISELKQKKIAAFGKKILHVLEAQGAELNEDTLVKISHTLQPTSSEIEKSAMEPTPDAMEVSLRENISDAADFSEETSAPDFSHRTSGLFSPAQGRVEE